MHFSRLGALALITGSLLTILVFLFHPSHVETRPFIGTFTLSQVVHGTAILAAPLLLFGMWEMAAAIGLHRSAVRLALILTALAMSLTVTAAVVSSFVTPAAARASLTMRTTSLGEPSAPASGGKGWAVVHGSPRTTSPPLVQVTVSLNRGLAQAHVALLSIALLMFGLALWPSSRVLGGAGVAVGSFPLLWQLSGSFSPETMTMPFIVFPQCGWLVAVAVQMSRPGVGESNHER